MQKPEIAVSEYYNYKGIHSIVLMALVDANYRFLWVDVGCQGRISDGGIFGHSSLKKHMTNVSLNIPKNEPLLCRNLPVPYVMVADDAFPVTSSYEIIYYRFK